MSGAPRVGRRGRAAGGAHELALRAQTVALRPRAPPPAYPGRSWIHQPLVHHGVRHLEEARDVGAVDVVARRAEALGGLDARLVDALHDQAQPAVDLLAGPAVAHAVLRHLEPRGGDAAGVGRLAGAVEDLRVDELVDAVPPSPRSSCAGIRSPP